MLTHENFELIIHRERLGFDPLGQHGTFGWRCSLGDEWYGAWLQLHKMPFDRQLKLFAESILAFLETPTRFKLTGATPAEYGTGDNPEYTFKTLDPGEVSEL